MDSEIGFLDHGVMVKKRKIQAPRKPRAPPKPLFIGAWIRLFRLKQVEVATKAGINEGYLSELIKGTNKVNPSYAVLSAIATAIGIPVDYLEKAPPDKQFIATVSGIDPEVLRRITQLNQ